MVTMRPARSRLVESSRTAGISLLLESTSTCLSEHHAGLVLGRRDHHPASLFGLLRGAAQVLAVHGDRRVSATVLGGPPADRVVQRLRCQSGEDVVEGGDRGLATAETDTRLSWKSNLSATRDTLAHVRRNCCCISASRQCGRFALRRCRDSTSAGRGPSRGGSRRGRSSSCPGTIPPRRARCPRLVPRSGAGSIS